MAIQQLVEYIKSNLDQGVNKDEIKSTLLGRGWQEAKVDEAFSSIDEETNGGSEVLAKAESKEALVKKEKNVGPAKIEKHTAAFSETKHAVPESLSSVVVKKSAQEKEFSQKTPPQKPGNTTLAQEKEQSFGIEDQEAEGPKDAVEVDSAAIPYKPPQAVTLNAGTQFSHTTRDSASKLSQSISSTKKQSFLRDALPVMLGSLLGFIVVAGGAFAFWYYFRQPTPLEVINKAMEHFSQSQSYAFEGNLTMNIFEDVSAISVFPFPQIAGLFSPSDFARAQIVQDPVGTFTLSFSGADDRHDPALPKGRFMFDMGMTINEEEFGNGRFALGAEILSIGTRSYIKLNTFAADVGSELGLLSFVFSPLQNQWISIDPEEITNLYGIEGLDEQLERARDARNFTPEEVARMKELFMAYNPFAISPVAGDDVLGGVHHYRYEIRLNEEGFRPFAREAALFYFEALSSRNLGVEAEQMAEIQNFIQSPAFDEALTRVYKILSQSLRADLWISRGDLVLRQAGLSFSLFSEDTGNKIADIAGSVSFSDYGVPVEVEAPSDAKPLGELFEELFGESFFPSQEDIFFEEGLGEFDSSSAT